MIFIMNSISIEFQSLFQYKEWWQVLICIIYGYAVAFKAFIRYLCCNYQMKWKKYLSLIWVISSLSIIEKSDDFPCSLNDSSSIDNILIHKGYKCNYYDNILIMNEVYMNLHIFNKYLELYTSKFKSWLLVKSINN